MVINSIVHCPLQVPKEQLDKFNFTNDENLCREFTPYVYPGYTNASNGADYKCRQIYHAMVATLDEIIGNITTLLKQYNLWDNTLLILSSDNGGPVPLGESGSNNTPLRGSKYSRWEGGIRVAAFVSGGYLPESRRGQKEYGMIAIADWYTTFCEMVGVDPFDSKGKEYGLPPVDGLNIWPLISGENNTSPRTQLPVFKDTLIDGDYKYLVGNISYASWGGNIYPNSSSPNHPIQGTVMDCTNGCLFNIVEDWTEHINIADENEDIVNRMANELDELKKGFYSNNEKGMDSCPPNITVECACWMAQNYWNSFFGPYQYMDNVTQISAEKSKVQ